VKLADLIDAFNKVSKSVRTSIVEVPNDPVSFNFTAMKTPEGEKKRAVLD